MWTPRIRAARAALAILLPLVAGACIRRLPDANASDVPALRAELQSRPDDPSVRTRLGIALYKAGEHQEAVTTLEPVVAQGDASGAANLYLGLAHEELGDWALTINPFDVEEQADAIYAGLTMPREERRARLDAICTQVRSHDVADWLEAQLADLDRLAPAGRR